MGKKILVANGSPRKNGNTAVLVDAFIEGAKEAGHTVTRFDLQEMNIKPCIGCLKGGSGGDPKSPCSQKDDMDKIYPAFLDADIFVFASPLYYWSFTAQLKMVIDRLFAVMEANDMQTPFKQSILLSVGEGGEEDYQVLANYYETLMDKLEWDDLGAVFAGEVLEAGDIEGHEALVEARKLGASIQ